MYYAIDSVFQPTIFVISSTAAPVRNVLGEPASYAPKFDVTYTEVIICAHCCCVLSSERCSEFSMRRRTDHELAWRWKRDAWRYNCRLSVLLGGPAGIRNTQEAVCRTDGGVSVMHAVFFFFVFSQVRSRVFDTRLEKRKPRDERQA